MRKQRLGLIQTADQLRFSYIAILQGAIQDLQIEPSNYDDLMESEEEEEEEESDSEYTAINRFIDLSFNFSLSLSS